jgi:ubiquinone/menaquinone biosynthesis C-methylase UbiE
MSDKRENIKTGYDKLSGKYDDMLATRKWWSKIGIKLVWGFPDTAYAYRVLGYIPNDFSGRVLDIPVGTGFLTCQKYSQLRNAVITCMDYSDGMLQKAKERFSNAEIANVTFRQGDVGALPFEDGAFDMVLSMNGFHAFPDKEAAFAEIHKALRSGGSFIGCFYICGVVKRTDWIINKFYVPRGWFTPPFMTYRQLGEKLHSMYSEVELWNVGGIAGFRCRK